MRKKYLILNLKIKCNINLFMVNRSYLTFSLGNVDHEPSGELPEHYQGDPWGNYSNYEKEEHWWNDSNFFDNPFEDDFEKSSSNPFESYEDEKHYQVLGLKRSASQEDIKEAFRNKARETHPDKIGGDGEQFKIVRESYETLIS